MSESPVIRPYQTSDRPGVEAVCVATGLSGRLPDLFADADLFSKLWLAPFLEGEPESCWVVEDAGQIVGYLVGSAQPGFKRRALRCLLPYLRQALGRWARGNYRHHPPSGRVLRWLFVRSLPETPPAPAGPRDGNINHPRAYQGPGKLGAHRGGETPAAPAAAVNFHFNLLPAYQGQGNLGAELGETFFSHLRAQGVGAFYIHVFVAHWLRGYAFYRRLGFRTYDLRPCSLYGDDSALGCFTQPVPPPGEGQVRRPRAPTRLSVVIPCRQDGDVLARMLASLAAQWHRPDEVIVVRDGPDSGCDEAVRICGIRGARVIAGDWGHAGRARNAGIAAAMGDVVIVADADATLDRELGAQVVAAFEHGAVWGMPRLAADGSSWGATRWVEAMNLVARLSPLPYGTCLFAARDALLQAGGYHAGLSWGEDTEIGLRLARRHRCRRVRAAATYSSRRFRGRDARELGVRVWRAMRAVGHVLRASRLPRQPLDISEALAFTREGETGS